MKYRCTTCDREFPDGIPEGAVQLTSRHRGRRAISYRLTDGSIHSLHEIKPMTPEHKHKLFHKKTPRSNCRFCYPPEPQPEPPVEQPELLQEVIQVLETLPQSDKTVVVGPEATKPEIEPDESQFSSITILSAAFARVSKRNSR